jgi:hypothetical protein
MRTDDKYEKHRRALRESEDHEHVVGDWHTELKDLGEDLNFTPEERQDLINAALPMMGYKPGVTVDRELERATDEEIEKATDHIYSSRYDREEERRDRLRISRHDRHPLA